MTPNIINLTNDSLVGTTHNIVKDSTKLKGEMFKSILMNSSVDKRIIQQYLGNINAFLNKYDDYANDVKSVMKKSNPSVVGNIIPYNIIKRYLYDKYDYAAVLPFTDGIIKGIKSDEFKKPEDFQDFFEFTTNKAFKGRAKSAAGLIEEVLSLGNEINPVVKSTAAEAALFKAIDVDSLFDRTDLREIYKSTEKAINFILFDMKEKEFKVENIKGLIYMINNVVEFINYTVIAYATRIFAICKYTKSFVRIEPMGESVEPVSTIVGYSVMKDADEMTFRDISKLTETCAILDKFLEMIGSKRCTDSEKFVRNLSAADMENNIFLSQLIGNQLREYIFTMRYSEQYYDPSSSVKSINRMKERLQEYMKSTSQAIQISNTPKQEMMHVIRGTEPKSNTIEAYQQMAYDLVFFTATVLGSIESSYNELSLWRGRELAEPNHTGSVITISTEILKLLMELYREISVASLYKGRDIEMKINDLKNSAHAHVMADLTIKVPGGIKSDTDTNSNMMSGVPDTTRLPLQLMDMYSMPSFNEFTMYDEYVKSLPGMENDLYYSEAIDVKNLLNAMQAFLKAIMQRFKEFFTNQSFQNAVAWCNKNKEAMQRMTFSPPMEVLPFKENTNISHIDKLINTLTNGFTPNTVKSEEALNKFIDSLYNGGDQKLINLFDTSKTDAKDARVLYRNWILFDLDPSDKNNVNVKSKTLSTDVAIKQDLSNIWFDNVANALKTWEGIQQKGKELDNAFTSLKGKIVGITNNATSTPPPINSDSKEEKEKVFDNKDLSELALTKIKTAIDHQWMSLFDAIAFSIKTQYRYIQEAYSKGKVA